MIGRKMTYAIVVILILILAFVGWKMTSRNAYESAEYSVVETDGRFEIRDYPDLMLVATEMQPESRESDGSFMRLFQYISGSNADEQKVAMTTPVFMEPESAQSGGQMGFVIPKKIAEQHVPEPTSENVKLHKRIGGRFAVIRFAGRMDDAARKTRQQELETWIQRKGLEIAGDAEMASYDPPWTPGPLRRNEILIRLKTDSNN